MDCHCVLKNPMDKKDKVEVYIYQPKTKMMEKIKKINKKQK
jgi:hypothetical protein